jgi:hypothetical protein
MKNTRNVMSGRYSIGHGNRFRPVFRSNYFSTDKSALVGFAANQSREASASGFLGRLRNRPLAHASRL